MPSLGPYCDVLGIQAETITDQLQKLESKHLSNGAIYEISQHMKTNKLLKWKDILPSLEIVYGRTLFLKPLLGDIGDVKTKQTKLMKNTTNKIQLKSFLENTFSLVRQHSQNSSPRSDNIEIPDLPSKKRKFEEFSDEVVKLASDGLMEDLAYLQECNNNLQEQNALLAKENKYLKQKLKQNDTNNLKHELKRKTSSVHLWKRKYISVKKQMKKSNETKHKLLELKREMSRYRTASKKKSYRQNKKLSEGRHQKNDIKLQKDSINILKDELAKGRDLIKQQADDIHYLEDRICTIENLGVYHSMKDGKSYSKKVRLASYILQDSGVSQKNCSKTLNNIINTLTGEELDSLPSNTTQNTFTREMRALSTKQVKEALSDADMTTLKYDGTMKRVGHIVETEATTKTGETYLLGMQQQPGGTAQQYVDSITSTCDSVGLNLQQISNTMSDRCVTNSAIHRKLEAIKDGTINDFKCAMHPLDSMAKSCEKEIKIYESSVTGMPMGTVPFTHRGESLTQATVRVVSKLFHSTQYFSENLQAYLTRVEGAKTYYRFVGNRFHVYFLSSGLLFSYLDTIKEYFVKICKPKNNVETSINNAINSYPLSVSLRALGLIGKAVSGPWMRLVGVKDLGILDLNTYFAEAINNLKHWSVDASPLLAPEGPPSVFQSVSIQRDRVLVKLSAVHPTNTDVEFLLRKLCTACLVVAERQLSTQLEGGIFFNPSQELLTESTSCSTTNISGERNFALADAQLNRVKNASIEFVTSRVMYRTNKTGKWLLQQTDEESDKYVEAATKEARVLLKKGQRSQGKNKDCATGQTHSAPSTKTS